MDLREKSRQGAEELVRVLERNKTSHAILLFPELLDRQIQRVKEAFPENAIHSIAVKTNPLLHVLKQIVQRGMGLECASVGEIHLAIAAGAEKTAILWDSPAKTPSEIDALKGLKNCWIQVDSLRELEYHAQYFNPNAKYALRITPRNINSRSDELNVAGHSSKFGVHIDDQDAILTAFQKYPFLTGIHVHGSSMEFDTSSKVAQLREVLIRCTELIPDFNHRIQHINIGGGLAFDYQHRGRVEVASYAEAIKALLREMALDSKDLLTEFGRYYHAPAAWCISRVEYTKGSNLIIHFGADAFLRESYSAHPLKYNVSLYNNDGEIKCAETYNYQLCGPLCFGGDFIQKQIALPEVKVGNYIAIEDTGANTFALWSRHCSRNFPAIYSWESGAQPVLLRAETSTDETVDFWS